MKKFLTKEYLYDFFIIILGNFLVALSFSFFLDPNNIVIGGATGAATILKYTLGLDTALTVLIINMVLLIISYFLIGREFFLKTLFSSLLLPLLISLLNMLYGVIAKEGSVIISDTTLVIVFSSIIMGIGIGLVMRKGGATGGTEIPQKILYKYFHIPYSVSLFLVDGIIILLGAIFIKEEGQVMDVHMILYAIIFMYISGMVIDQIVFSGFNSRAVHIISDKNDIIQERILKDFSRGVTRVEVVGGYTGDNKTKLICILSSSEFYKLKALIEEVDPNAFFYVVRANEVSGEGFTRKK